MFWKSLLYSETKLYVTALVYHWLDEFLSSACHVLVVLQERRVRENGQKDGESKREPRKRVRTTREVRKGGHFSKG